MGRGLIDLLIGNFETKEKKGIIITFVEFCGKMYLLPAALPCETLHVLFVSMFVSRARNLWKTRDAGIEKLNGKMCFQVLNKLVSFY